MTVTETTAVRPGSRRHSVFHRLRVASARVKPVSAGGVVGPAQTIACDALLMSGGWTPSVHLFSHTKGKLDWDDERQMFLPGKPTEECRSAGACNGRFGLKAALDDGAAAAFLP